MKRFLIAGFIVGLLSSVGYAKVEKKVDSFSDTILISSRIFNVNSPYCVSTDLSFGNIAPFSSVGFAKGRTSDNEPEYLLGIGWLASEWWFFKESPLEMKIEGKVYFLPIADTDSKMYSSNLSTNGVWVVDKEMQKRILKANFIIIRVHYSNHPFSTWEVPSEVLDEWKQVIRAEFNK